MSSTDPALHFVRCPKCLKVLREPPGVSLYGCGGCGAILRAKSHFSSQETMSLASAASSWKNMLNSGSFDNEITTSDRSGINDGVEFSGNVVKNHAESISNIRNLEEKKKSHVEEDQPPTKTESGLNEKEKESSNQEISKANGSFRSDNTLEESTESPEHDTISEDDEVNGKIRNDRRFLLRSSSSHAYDGSISSTGIQARNRDFSFVSEDFHSALNFTGSIDSANSESQSKAAKQFVKFRQPEKSDQARILRKVDELRNELRVLFNRAAEASVIDSSAHFQGKVSPNQCRALQPHQESGRCNEHCRSCRSNVRCNLPEVGASIHPLRPSLHQGTQTREPIIKRSQEVKRRCRPVSGGAPFVICYRCYSVLQLPSDFLMSTKRVHKLRCGSCSEVLRYTFIPRTRSDAQTPAEVRLPPSEDDEKVAAPHSNYSREGDPVSYSEEYEPSFVKSNSFEAKKSPLLGRNYGAIVEEEHGGKRLSGVRLHKLMGYSSARHLLFETLSPVEGQRTEHDR